MPQVVAVAVLYEYEPRSIAAVWNSIRLANRCAEIGLLPGDEVLARGVELAGRPADLPAIEQFLVSQERNGFRRPREGPPAAAHFLRLPGDWTD